MNNPFTGSYQKDIQETSQIKQELNKLYKKQHAMAKLYHQLRGLLRVCAAEGVSAADMERRYEEITPDEEGLLRAIMESTSSSISGEQLMPAAELEEDDALLAIAEESASEGSCDIGEVEPESKRARLHRQLTSC